MQIQRSAIALTLASLSCAPTKRQDAIAIRVEMAEGDDSAVREVRLNGTQLSGTELDRVPKAKPPLVACRAETRGAERECGWTFAGIGRCEAGSTVSVGAAAACGLGSCEGDSIIRVCRGDSPCAHRGATTLGENDDACDSKCSKVTFRCPRGGTYAVLVANQSSADSAAVRVAASAGTFPVTRAVGGSSFKGTILTGVDAHGQPMRVRIADVEPDPKDPEKELSLYTVQVPDASGKGWESLCTPDINHVAKAIPLQGTWDESGRHVASDAVTFACTAGVLAKCVRWGYKPWKTVRGRSLEEFHQACTRMARADYCGDGKHHTRDGTPIDLYDVLDVQTRTPNSGWSFEAAWGPDGALCVRRARWFETVPDLWAECPKKLSGRTNEDGRCDSPEKARQSFPKALMFNDSIVRTP